MSSTKLDTSGVFQTVTLETAKKRLDLPAYAVHIRKNGIEFLSPSAVPAWAEMTVELKSPKDGKRVRAIGIVVGCHGNRHSGYAVSIVFLSLSRQAQERLEHLASAYSA